VARRRHTVLGNTIELRPALRAIDMSALPGDNDDFGGSAVLLDQQELI
jgi:hypothetical protein